MTSKACRTSGCRASAAPRRSPTSTEQRIAPSRVIPSGARDLLTGVDLGRARSLVASLLGMTAPCDTFDPPVIRRPTPHSLKNLHTNPRAADFAPCAPLVLLARQSGREPA